jgi:hypothetical protein
MELLSGWKEIAEHLHLNVRTAQRWERLGLPVRRVSDSSCSPVVAIPDELELWARTRDVKSDAAVLSANKYLTGRLAELRKIHCQTRHKTRALIKDLRSLTHEQERLVFRIRSSLAVSQSRGGREWERKSARKVPISQIAVPLPVSGFRAALLEHGQATQKRPSPG